LRLFLIDLPGRECLRTRIVYDDDLVLSNVRRRIFGQYLANNKRSLHTIKILAEEEEVVAEG
jgi:hypothetical protein